MADVMDGPEIISRSAKKTGPLKYSPSLYNKYYSASDFIIRLKTDGSEKIWLDKAVGVAVSESLSSVPVYTVGNSRFQFLSKGNLIVNGLISINTTSSDYMAKVLANINAKYRVFKVLTPSEQLALTAEELKKYQEEKKKFDQEKVEVKSSLGFSDYDLFTIELVYNNSDAIDRRTSFSREIIDCRIVGYEQGVDIGGDGQLIDGYRFIAREVI